MVKKRINTSRPILVKQSRKFKVWQRKLIANSQEITLEYISLKIASESVMIFGINKDKQIILIKKYFPASNSIEIVLPGGKIEVNQRAKQTAVREMVEETGYKPNSLKSIGSLQILPGYFVGKTHGFFTNNLYRVGPWTDKNETLEILLCNRKEIIDMITKGKITDSRSVAFILKTFNLFPNL